MRSSKAETAELFNQILPFIRREKLYIFLLTFIILANLSLSSLNNVFEDSGLAKIFDKEKPADETGTFDHKIMETVTSDSAVYLIFQLLLLLFIFFTIFGLAIDAIYLYGKTADKNPIIATQSINTASWGFLDICKVIIIFLFVETVASFGAIYAALALPPLPANRNFELMLVATALDVVVIAAIFYFVLGERRQNIASLGLTARNIFLNIRYGIAAYVGLIPIFLGVTVLTSVLFKVLNIPVEPQEVVRILKEEKGVPLLIYMCVFTSFLGPFMEEIFFRGFVYGVLKKKIGILGGVLTSALFFACIHANMASFMPILSLGILLAYIYEKTGSLVSSITVHVIHNSAMLAFLLFLKSVAG